MLSLVVVLLLAAPAHAAPSRLPAAAGSVRFFRVANSAFDRYTTAPSAAQQEWMRQKYWRMLGYSPYFDTRLAWFPEAWVYKDLYGVDVQSALARDHPEWILRDRSGSPLYVRYGCSGGACPQYAADPGNVAFRTHWLDEAAAVLRKGYAGLYVDDVNMSISRVSDGTGTATPPVDPRTGAPMTEAAWRRYMADFTTAIRAAFPDHEIVHNVLWFVGHDDPDIRRQLASADVIGLERGVNDAGIRGGSGTYGFDTFLSYVDWLHKQRRSVVFDADAKSDAAREYGLAAYFLVNANEDGLGNHSGGTPGDWWSGYEVHLGAPAGTRYAWNGVVRRDFGSGIVLVNPPDADELTVALGATYRGLDGKTHDSVTLGPAHGIVLLEH